MLHGDLVFRIIKKHAIPITSLVGPLHNGRVFSLVTVCDTACSGRVVVNCMNVLLDLIGGDMLNTPIPMYYPSEKAARDSLYESRSFKAFRSNCEDAAALLSS